MEGANLESRSAESSLVLERAGGLGPREPAWCWGRLKACVCGNWPGPGPGWDPGFAGEEWGLTWSLGLGSCPARG